MLRASVIICTYNRAYYLSELIENLLSQTISNIEIIIVNNASDDNTADIILSYKKEHDNIVYVHEDRLGLSYARNAGLNAANSPIVVFIDDDERPTHTWLESHLRCYEEDTNVVAVGGKITLEWLEPRPGWLPDNIDPRLGQFDLGPVPQPIKFPKYPFGGNMSFKKDLLLQLGGFSTNLGLKGHQRYANEEKEIFARIDQMDNNALVFYSPSALVYHKTDPALLKGSYFFSRQYLQGVSDIVLRRKREFPLRPNYQWVLRGFRAFAYSFISFLKCLMGIIFFNKRFFICRYMEMAYWLGYGKECLTPDQSGLKNRAVLFIPDYSQGNPYQKELAKNLENFGVKVIFQNHASGPLALTKSIIKNKKVSILHIHWMDSLVPISTHPLKSFIKKWLLSVDFLLVKLFGRKIIWTVHNRISHASQNRILELHTRRLLAKNSTKIIIHCPRILEDLSSFYKINKNKFAVIPHGHFIDSYPNSISKDSARQHLLIPGNHIVYLCLGSIRTNKGCLDLINSFLELNNTDSTLIIAGNPTTPQIDNEINLKTKEIKNIKYYPHYIDEDRIQIFINASDIVVLPYQDILNSGIAVLAMSFKKALIAPQLGCLPDMIDNKGGIFFKPLSDHGLRNCLQQATTIDLESMGENNFNTIKNYPWQIIAGKTYQLYQN